MVTPISQVGRETPRGEAMCPEPHHGGSHLAICGWGPHFWERKEGEGFTRDSAWASLAGVTGSRERDRLPHPSADPLA